MVKKEQPEHITTENGNEIAEVAVTVEGTWQKRGHSSTIGVVFILTVLTREILNYEIKSLVCFECRARENMNKDSDEYKIWKASHSSCQINHCSSSEDMQAWPTAKGKDPVQCIYNQRHNTATYEIAYFYIDNVFLFYTFLIRKVQSCVKTLVLLLQKIYGSKFTIYTLVPSPTNHSYTSIISNYIITHTLVTYTT